MKNLIVVSVVLLCITQIRCAKDEENHDSIAYPGSTSVYGSTLGGLGSYGSRIGYPTTYGSSYRTIGGLGYGSRYGSGYRRFGYGGLGGRSYTTRRYYRRYPTVRRYGGWSPSWNTGSRYTTGYNTYKHEWFNIWDYVIKLLQHLVHDSI